MAKTRVLAVVTGLFLLGAVPASASEGAPDQSQTLATSDSALCTSSEMLAQTFTAGVTGTLTGVDLALRWNQHPPPLSVEVRSTAAGLPTGTVLARALVEAVGDENSPTWVSVPLSVESAAGATYALVLAVPSLPGVVGPCTTFWAWGGSDADPYAGGDAYLSLAGSPWLGPLLGSRTNAFFDNAFRTYVAPDTPTSSEQCKLDGWRAFPSFENQGECVSYVATHGRNAPRR